MTVVVPVFNGAHVLGRAADAILSQKVDRIVYVDDGSRDGTPGALAAVAERDERVLVVSHETNRGRAAARNTGVRRAVGERLLFLDADVVPEPDWATTCASALQDPKAVAAIGRLDIGDLSADEPYHQYLTSSLRGPQRERDVSLPWRHFLTTAVAVDREAFEQAGGFPERVGYGEDLALACRLARTAPDGLRFAPGASATMFDPGDLDSALDKVRQFARSLPEIVAHCPDALRVAGLGRLVSDRWMDRALLALARSQPPARLLRSQLSHMPRALRPRAVRYLLGHALAVHAADAFAHAS